LELVVIVEEEVVDDDDDEVVDDGDVISCIFFKVTELDLDEPHIEHTSKRVECLLKHIMHVHFDLLFIKSEFFK